MNAVSETTYRLDYNIGFTVDMQEGEFADLLKVARTFVNPWAIRQMPEGRTIAMSYDGFTSWEHAQRNGRE